MDLGALSKRLGETRAKVTGMNKVNWIKLPKEKGVQFVFRILPYTDKGDIGYIQNFHFKIGNNKPLACLVEEEGVECPLCRVMKKYDFDLTKSFLSKGMVSLNIQIQGKDRNTVYALRVPVYLIEWLEEISKVSGASNLFDPKLGRDIIMYRKFDNGAFVRQLSLEARPISKTNEGIKAILAKTTDFSKYYKKITDEEISLIETAASEFDKEMYNKVKENTAIKDSKKKVNSGKSIKAPSVPFDTKSEDPTLPACFGEFKSLEDDSCIACNSLAPCMTKSNI